MCIRRASLKSNMKCTIQKYTYSTNFENENKCFFDRFFFLYSIFGAKPLEPGTRIDFEPEAEVENFPTSQFCYYSAVGKISVCGGVTVTEARREETQRERIPII